MGSRSVAAMVVVVLVLGAAVGMTMLAAADAGAAAAGKVLWSRQMSTRYGHDDYPRDLAVGPDGSAYVLSGVGRGDDIYQTVMVLARYSPGGRVLWQRTFSAGGTYSPAALAVDGKGNAYVVGNTGRLGDETVGVVLKYSAAGRRSWVRRWVTATPGDYLWDIACDAAGNVVVCGEERDSETSAKMFTRRYRPNGSIRWTRRYRLARTVQAGARALALDRKTGAIYVAGYAISMLVPPEDRNADVLVVKYSRSGARVWAKTWGSSSAARDYAGDLVLGPTGEVYVNVTSIVGNGDVSPLAAVLNFGAGGRLHWSDAAADKSPQPDFEDATAITVDGRDRLRSLLLEGPSGQVVVRLYDRAGKMKWQRPLPVSGEGVVAYGMVTTSKGRSYIVGTRGLTPGGSAQLFVTALRGDGRSALWTTYRGGRGGAATRGYLVALRQGRLYASGYAETGTTGADVMTLRLAP